MHLWPLAADVPIPDAEALQAAIDVARTNFGPDGTAVAIPATVTVDGYLEGGEGTPRRIEDRPAIGVQITGLSMPPFWQPARGSASRQERIQHRARCLDRRGNGEYLMASSTR